MPQRQHATRTKNGQRSETKKCCKNALQPYRGMYLLHDAKSIRAVAAENNHDLARSEDVQVSIVEVYAAATNSEKSVSWYTRTK